jgi:hypothetical protein
MIQPSQKFFLSAILLVTASAGVAHAADPEPPACRPVQIAETTQCVKDQLKSFRKAKTYNETTTVADNSDGTKTVTFIFEPKCLHAAVPCRIASRSIISTVDCKAGTATCPG